MTGPWGKRESLMLAFGVVAALSVSYCVGKSQGKIDQQLTTNTVQTKANDHVTKVDSTARVVQVKKSDSVRVVHAVARAKVQVKADTVTFVGKAEVHGDTVTVISRDLSSLITVTDQQPKQDSLTIAAVLLENDDLRHGIVLRDQRIRILEDEKHPRFGFKTGVVVGATGTVAVVTIAVKIIRAIGHK